MLDWAGKQTYLALANMMTAAAQIGIDSCPIEGFNFDKVQAVLEEADLLEDGHLAVSAMVACIWLSQSGTKTQDKKTDG